MRMWGRIPAILFPSAMISNADPNALDDYEELNFTPAIAFAGAITGVTYGSGGQIGRCTKIGRMVHVEGRVTLTSKGSLTTGAAMITGLPFSGLSIVPAGPFRYQNVSLSTGTVLGGYVNTNYIQLQMLGAVSSADVLPANLSNTTDILFSAHYMSAT